MSRLLISSGRKCPFGCSYCFAKFSQYSPLNTLAEIEQNESLLQGISLVYPCCDDDIFASPNAIDVIARVARWRRSISVSTKARLSESIVKKLSLINEALLNNGCILKASISISTRFRISEIERGTACFSDRKRNLELLELFGIPSSVVLKPLLSDEPASTYRQILIELQGLTKNLLVGDEYLDWERNSRFMGNASTRRVGWLPDFPVWPVQENASLKKEVSDAARDLGYRVFDNDLDLVSAIARERLLQHQRDYEWQRDNHHNSWIYPVCSSSK